MSDIVKLFQNLYGADFGGREVVHSGREIAIHCVFHDNRRSPTLYVNPDKGTFYCQSANCDAHGVDLNLIAYHLFGVGLDGGKVKDMLTEEQFRQVIEFANQDEYANENGFRRHGKDRDYTFKTEDTYDAKLWEGRVRRWKLNMQRDPSLCTMLEKEHGIDRATAMRFNIGYTGNGRTGKERILNHRFAFPHYAPDFDMANGRILHRPVMRLVGCNCRVAERNWRSTGHKIPYYSAPGGKHAIFNARVLSPNNLNTDVLFIVEAEKCAMVVDACGFTNVIAMSGSGRPRHARQWIRRFSEVIVIGDNDKNGAGQKSAAMRVEWIGEDKAVMVVPPNPHKDVSDFAYEEGCETCSTWLCNLL